MASNILTKIFGSRNDRLLKQYRKTVVGINALESQYEKLSDEQLRAKTDEFRGRVAQGEQLDAILPEAFAVVRVPTPEEEAARWISRQREQLRRERQRLEAQGRSLLLTQSRRVAGRAWLVAAQAWEQLGRPDSALANYDAVLAHWNDPGALGPPARW